MCEVTAVTRPTPRTARVELRSDDLVGVHPVGPDQRVKLVFPEGRRFGDDPAEMSRARRRRRTYTLLDLDPETGACAVEFVLHEGGLAGEWAAAVQPGDQVATTTPVGRFELVPGTSEVVLIADETGVPALRAIAAEVTAHPDAPRVRAHVEVADAGERREMPGGVEVDWLLRSDGATLPDLVGRLTVGPDATVWIAGESDVVRDLRVHVITELGLDRSRVNAVAYWIRGRAEGDPAAGRPGEHTPTS